MYSVSSAFKTTLLSSNMVVVTKVQASDGTVLTVSDGSVSMDSTRDIIRTCSLELTPTPTLTNQAIYNLVKQPGIEITIWRGLQINGSTELVPLGVFSTDEAEQSQTISSTVRWTGSDRSKKIARARFLDPYAIASGTTLAAAGTALLQSRLANVSCDFSNVTETINVNIAFDAGADSNPWKSVRDLFADYGYYLYFDGLGTARATAILDPATVTPVFDFGSGTTAMVLDGTAKTSLEGVYNGVVVTGEGTDIDPPVRAVAWDTDPTSPTYYLSGFGQVPYFFTSAVLTTLAAAQKAANTLLARLKGRFQQLSFPTIVNPALEPLDVVSVTFYSTTSKVVLDSLTIPLKATDAMSANARATSI